MVKKVLAFDFGASSGRAILGSLNGTKLQIKEIYRFENNPITKEGTLYWDIIALFSELKNVLKVIGNDKDLISIAIDTWGVDYGLINQKGELMQNPVHYRDSRTDNITADISDSYLETLYELTGIQQLNINTLFQLMAEKRDHPTEFAQLEKILLMPDLFNYFLTGKIVAERTIASTTQLFNPYTKQWEEKVFQLFGLPEKIMPDLISPGQMIGTLSSVLANELSIPNIPVVAVCSHDTASAVVSVPEVEDKPFLFISSGTWSLVGTELTNPIINSTARFYNLTNESGLDSTTHFLKNMTGLWIIQEVKRQLEQEGKFYSYDEINTLATQARKCVCLLDTDAVAFLKPGDMVRRIKTYARKTNQEIPATDGEIFRCVYESLAMKYVQVKQEIEEITKNKFTRIYIIGGGSKAELLCQLTADFAAVEVITGPVEASAIGNVAVQFMASGDIESLAGARELIQASFPIKRYTPIIQKEEGRC
ncbi:rhamnulokinase [Listeria ivanovii]|uniref:rhamnulokinase n=1 Tax=Listeria ivanovii TaxID=1638 RepID=UPI000DAA249E|nr:rhamnulokinase family protein [Listeria ivanovii]PZG39968.1 rhamnulokinase [Listeria ivanovii]